METAIKLPPLDRSDGRDSCGGMGVSPAVAQLTVSERDTLACRDAALGQMAGGIAHDFNNLITIILGYAELVRPHVCDDCGCELLDALEGAATQAGRLAEQLLMLARQQPLGRGSLDLSVLVQELAGLFRRVFSKQITLVVQTAPGLRVRGVSVELTQVILNLCLNARDAMPRGGTLTLRTEIAVVERDPDSRDSEGWSRSAPRTSSFVLLRIADTGDGIPPEVLLHIFEPYFTTRPGQGSGIGLATVHRIVAEHGGWIECESEPGRGSCFD